MMKSGSSVKCDRLDWSRPQLARPWKMRRRTVMHWCGACHRTSDAKVKKSMKASKRNSSERNRIFSVYILPLSWVSCLYIYMCVCVCTQALLSILWGFDDDFYSLLVTPLQGVNSELSSQWYGSWSMLCNDLLPSEDGFVHPCLATITGGTSLGISFVPAHDYKRRWCDWTYQTTNHKSPKTQVGDKANLSHSTYPRLGWTTKHKLPKTWMNGKAIGPKTTCPTEVGSGWMTRL